MASRSFVLSFFQEDGTICSGSIATVASEKSSNDAGTSTDSPTACKNVESGMRSRPDRKRKSTVNQLTVPPMHPIGKAKQLEKYPGGIQDPFPFIQGYHEFLKNCKRSELVESRHVLHAMTRDVYKTLCGSLRRTPNKLVWYVFHDLALVSACLNLLRFQRNAGKDGSCMLCGILFSKLQILHTNEFGLFTSSDELTVTAKRLCQEYPVLQCGLKQCYTAFCEILKKCAKNAEYFKKKRRENLSRPATKTIQITGKL